MWGGRGQLPAARGAADKRGVSRPGLLLLLLLPLLARPVAADEIVLQSGGRLEGEIVEITDERVVLKIPHGQIILERRQVAEIRREDAID